MTPRIQRRILLILGFTLSPLFLLTLLIVFSAVNPMGLMFLTSFEVENATEETIFVTPIGAVGKDGLRMTLPHSGSSRLYIMSAQTREFMIPPNSTRKFTYDWDDIQFSEILFRTPGGEYYVIPTGLHPTENQYRRPETTYFQISDSTPTELADILHLRALELAPPRIWIVYILSAFGILSPIFLVSGFRIKKNAEHARGRQRR